jgi:hypothetical protein
MKRVYTVAQPSTLSLLKASHANLNSAILCGAIWNSATIISDLRPLMAMNGLWTA